MKFRYCFFTLLFSAILGVMQTVAAVIPEKYIGNEKWVTLKTDNGYYFYAIEEDGLIKLGQTPSLPTSGNYAAYCWKIEGDAVNGYTFRCLKYDRDPRGKMYITDPSTLATANQEVLLSTIPSRYRFTDNRQLELVAQSGLYLAFYSVNWHTIRLHDSADYIGSRMTFGLSGQWDVAAIVYGSEVVDAEGHIQGTTLPTGGVSQGTDTYVHASNYEGKVIAPGDFTQLLVDGYSCHSIKIDEESMTIVSYYVYGNSDYVVKDAGTTKDQKDVKGNVVTGADNTIVTLLPQNYMTNGEGLTKVPSGRPWQMDVTLSVNGSNLAFNEWGSTVLASVPDPFDKWYHNGFQVYLHKAGTLNFKSNSNNNYIIAKNKNFSNATYKVTVRYEGATAYTVRTVALDNAGQEKAGTETKDAWITASPQGAISQLSCALPTGINIKDFTITLADPISGLLPGVEYAIQNNANNMYLSWDYANPDNTEIYRKMAGYWAAADASKCKVQFTDHTVTYDNKTYNSFYIMTEVWNGTTNEWKYIGADNMIAVADADKKAFIFADKKILPVGDPASPSVGTPWSLYGSQEWNFDMFANFRIQINGNKDGRVEYKTQEYGNNDYCEFPANAQSIQYSNKSLVGYTASISKENIYLKADYKALSTGFYNFEDHRFSTPESDKNLTYYWDNGEKKLVLVSKGTLAEWNDPSANNLARGDAHQFSITPADTIPVKLNKNTVGTDPDNKYYGSLFSPVALKMPSGVTAYILSSVSSEYYHLVSISGNVLPASTPAILVSETKPEGTWDIISDQTSAPEGNLLLGSALPVSRNNEVTSYVLSGKSGIGFYRYTGATIPAFKAYHELSGTSQARYIFNFDDVTSVDTLIHHPATGDEGIYYDLTGRIVTQPVSGRLYIHNGNKIVY